MDYKKLLTTNYTTSITDICNLLCVDRSFVNRFINNNIRSIRIPRDIAEKLEYSNLKWFHTNDFYKLLENNISISSQTWSATLDAFLSDDQLAEYYSNVFSIMEKNIEEDKEILSQVDRIKLFDKFYPEWFRPYAVNGTKKGTRSKIPFIDAKIEDTGMEFKHMIKEASPAKILSVLLGYNYDEILYRQLFNHGAWRLNLRLPDNKHGTVSDKIYYIKKPTIGYDERAGRLTFPISEYENVKKNLYFRSEEEFMKYKNIVNDLMEVKKEFVSKKYKDKSCCIQ